jgi:hypothetical protein
MYGCGKSGRRAVEAVTCSLKRKLPIGVLTCNERPRLDMIRPIALPFAVVEVHVEVRFDRSRLRPRAHCGARQSVPRAEVPSANLVVHSAVTNTSSA